MAETSRAGLGKDDVLLPSPFFSTHKAANLLYVLVSRL